MVCCTSKGDKTIDEKRIISKIHPFGVRVFEDKNLFVIREYRFFKAIEPRECVGIVVFSRDKVNVRVELFNIIEPVNDAGRSSIVSCNVELVSMDVYDHSEEHSTKLG